VRAFSVEAQERKHSLSNEWLKKRKLSAIAEKASQKSKEVNDSLLQKKKDLL
jgi:hypothetical protein